MLRGLCHQWNVECARYNEQINSRMRAGFATLGVTIDYEAPRGTIEETCPKESLLDEAANKTALANPEVQKSLDAQSAESTYRTPEQLEAFYQSEIKRFGDLIHKLNLTTE